LRQPKERPQEPIGWKDGTLLKFLIVIFVVVIAGGVVFLATWDIPAPTHPVEKVIPNDRFSR
jgi:hypothetical protein